DWIDSIWRNDISRNWSPSQRVNELHIRQQVGKIPVPLPLCQHNTLARGICDRTDTFVADKEKGLVFPNGAAQSRAKLILAQFVLRLRCRQEIIPRIECFIPEELENIAMELFGPGLQLNVDIRAGVSAIFRGIVAGLNFELFDGIERWINVHIVMAIIHHSDAIDVHLTPD